ncbi:phosphate/phosphite/phosphonate ABC transporter substrate-binding protein [Macrococcus capreoli]|uniref:phosphate/phosphite/phosphonate ABC transporter substrate-binding protein n=1 Tax=Macrococcus capreoli TaxID=2982690 RepID=UPI0021D5850D|nr:phosphate/phosphite/phosphonate ABC transporter substrate-binding protein [Macrococcus sp. TMW 2.2395]MCU7557879.1 phosphate/phosphite/phosphonate ABC transporter substrate-binding protein [Macrococcus sp. TMW 2.2395]
MFKKTMKTAVPVILAATVLGACGGEKAKDGSKEASKSYTPEKLTVQFVPSQNAETLEAKAKPLEQLLKKEIGIPVEVSVSTNYNTIVEAMKSKKVDVGFLPPTAYVLAHDQKAADVILQAQRYGVNDDGTPTKELVDFYKSQFIVKKDSDIKSLKDMKGKKIAMQDVTSTAGYVFPAVDLKNEKIDPLKDMEVTTVKGHDQAVISLLNGDVDVAVTFQDARNIVKKDQPNVFKDTRIVKYTEKIPNDTISVRSDMSDEWKKKLTDAFIKIGKDKEGQKIIREVYSHEGYVKSDDSKFDIIRDYDKKVKE